MNLSRLFHCSVIKVLCVVVLATAFIFYQKHSSLSTTFLFFFVAVSSDSSIILSPAVCFVNSFFLCIQKFFKGWLSHPMPSFVLTFLLYVSPHQRQLAYNSTATGRSQHISPRFPKVGHLPVFAAIVWIVLIICAILVFRACVENLLYLKRYWRLLPQTLDVHYLHFTAVSSRSLPPLIKADRFPFAQNLVKLSRSLNRLLRKKSPISPFT